MVGVSMHRPRAIVFDILGTASKSGFLERVLFPYLRANLEPFVDTHWQRKDFLKLYARILDQSGELRATNGALPPLYSHEHPEARAALMAYVYYVLDNGLNSAPVTQLRFKVWFEGYNQGRLMTPIYRDVADKLRQWFQEGIKFYVFSNTWVEAQRALLYKTNHGDLTKYISGHFDNDFGSLNVADSWRRLCSQIKETPNEVLFLTKSAQEAAAAREASIPVCLVLTHRHNVKAVSHDDRQRFPWVRTLDDLSWSDGQTVAVAPALGVGGAGTPATVAAWQRGQGMGAPSASGPPAPSMGLQPGAAAGAASMHASMSTQQTTSVHQASSARQASSSAKDKQ